MEEDVSSIQEPDTVLPVALFRNEHAFALAEAAKVNAEDPGEPSEQRDDLTSFTMEFSHPEPASEPLHEEQTQTPGEETVRNEEEDQSAVTLADCQQGDLAGNRSASCLQCGRSFSQPSDLENHQNVCCGAKSFQCSHCPRTFTHLMDLKTHKCLHAGETNFPCTWCEKAFASSEDLKLHMFIHRICTLCGKMYQYPSEMQKHLRSHTGERPYKCDVCAKRFSRATVRNRHQRNHMVGLSGANQHKLSSETDATDCEEDAELGQDDDSSVSCTGMPAGKSPSGSVDDLCRSSDQSIARQKHDTFSISCVGCGLTFAFPDEVNLHIHQVEGDKPFLCPDCGKAFPTKAEVVRHLKSTFDSLSHHRCDRCEEVFAEMRHCKAHKLVHHICPVCGLFSRSAASVRRHVREHVALEETSNCKTCMEEFGSSRDLSWHMAVHTGQLVYSCLVCGEAFHTQSLLEEHKLEHGAKSTLELSHCGECGELFPLVTDLLRHQLQHDPVCGVQCHLCRAVFKTAEVLDEHLARHEACNCYCEFCGEDFLSSGELQEHLDVHKKGSMYQCPVCGKEFRWIVSYNLHQQTHRDQASSPGLQAGRNEDVTDPGTNSPPDSCPSSAPWKGGKRGEDPGLASGVPSGGGGEGSKWVRDALDRLMADLTSRGRMMKCRVCGQGLPSLAALENHQHTRLDGTPHQCGMCGKNFAQSSNLLRHMRSHTGYHMHKCSECNKSFTCQSELRRHLVVHTGHRPYVCAECGKGFSQKGNYLGHLRRHASHHSVSCQRCGASFTCKADLNKHLITHMSVEAAKKGVPIGGGTTPVESLDISVKPFHCEECGRDFRVQQAFINHRCKGGKKHLPAAAGSCSALEDEALPIHFGIEKAATGSSVAGHTHSSFDTSWRQMQMGEREGDVVSADDGASGGRGKTSEARAREKGSHHSRQQYSCHLCSKRFDLCSDLEAHLASCHTDSTRQSSEPSAVLVQDKPAMGSEVDEASPLPSASGMLQKPCPEQLQTSSKTAAQAFVQSEDETVPEKQTFTKQCSSQPNSGVDTSRSSSGRQDDSRLKFKCNVCGAKHKSPSDLTRHMTRHCEERKFACSVCNKKFKQRCNLVRHQRSHSGRDCHQCSVCSQVFTNSSDLRRHLNLHTGTKPFQCKICGHQFCQRGNFNRHKLKHQKGNDYVCRICSTSLTNARDFKRHLDKHREEKAFAQLSESRKHSCRLCGRSFLFLFQVTKHMAACHNVKRKRRQRDSSGTNRPTQMESSTEPQAVSAVDLPEEPEEVSEEKPDSPQVKDERTEAEKFSFFHALQISHISAKPPQPQNPPTRYSRRKSRRPVQAYKDFDLSFSESDDVLEEGRHGKKSPESGAPVTLRSSRMDARLRLGAKDSKSSNGTSASPGDVYDSRVCSLCSQSFETDVDYFRHIHQQCSVCNRRFLCKREMDSHATSHYTCPYCQKVFAYPSTLKNHMRCHTGESPYECEVCGKKFRQSSGFYRHRRSHPIPETMPCTICEKTFTSTDELQEHLSSHVAGSPFKCRHCPATFLQQELLQQHLSSHAVPRSSETRSFRDGTDDLQYLPGSAVALSRYPPRTVSSAKDGQPQDLRVGAQRPAGEPEESLDGGVSMQEEALNLSKCRSSRQSQEEEMQSQCDGSSQLHLFPCPVCDKPFKNESSMLRHEKEIHGSKRHACSICSRAFAYLSQLVRHLKMHSENRPYTCYKCSKVFPSHTALEKHKREIHRAKKSYKCAVCGKAFQVPSQFEQHLKDHRMNVAYQCKLCQEAFGVEANLWAHMEEHVLKTHNCDVCGMSFPSAKECKDHVDTHGLDKPYRCKICGKGYGWMSNLKSHMKSHQERQHSCQECDKSFVSFKDLRVHLRVHSGEKPFQCEICSKSFSQSSTLYTHKRIMHQSESLSYQGKDFVCGVCSKIFHSEKALKLHTCSSEGKKLYNCDLCTKTYTTLGGLSFHRKTKHKDGTTRSKGSDEPRPAGGRSATVGAGKSGSNSRGNGGSETPSTVTSQSSATDAAPQSDQTSGGAPHWEPSRELLYQGFI